MRLFPFHIFIKDCSCLILYFVLLRFNVTGETYLPEMVRNFPEAPKMSFTDMVFASLFLGILPMFVSGFLYTLLYFILDKPFERRGSWPALAIGFLLAFSFPITCYVAGADFFGTRAGTYALILSFLISMATYYLFNAERSPWSARRDGRNGR